MEYRKYTKEDYVNVLQNKTSGQSAAKTSELLDIPLSTVSKWYGDIGKIKYSEKVNNTIIKINSKEDFLRVVSVFNNLDSEICIALYSYLFGLYLGDGNIYNFGRTERISYALDNKYLMLNKFTIDCMLRFFGKSPSFIDKTKYSHPSNSIMLQTCSKYLDLFFPQHGSGLKNSRKIELMQWQKDILNPVEFLRGLIYSDGCYVVANGFNSNRYEFTNTSMDIIEIYKENLVLFV